MDSNRIYTLVPSLFILMFQLFHIWPVESIQAGSEYSDAPHHSLNNFLAQLEIPSSSGTFPEPALQFATYPVSAGSLGMALRDQELGARFPISTYLENYEFTPVSLIPIQQHTIHSIFLYFVNSFFNREKLGPHHLSYTYLTNHPTLNVTDLRQPARTLLHTDALHLTEAVRLLRATVTAVHAGHRPPHMLHAETLLHTDALLTTPKPPNPTPGHHPARGHLPQPSQPTKPLRGSKRWRAKTCFLTELFRKEKGKGEGKAEIVLKIANYLFQKLKASFTYDLICP